MSGAPVADGDISQRGGAQQKSLETATPETMLDEALIRLRVLFSQTELTTIVQVPSSTTIDELRKLIMSEANWPKDRFGAVESIARIRLFVGGRELKASTTVGECGLKNTDDLPAAVHCFVVHPKRQSNGEVEEEEVEKKVLKSSPTCCFCCRIA